MVSEETCKERRENIEEVIALKFQALEDKIDALMARITTGFAVAIAVITLTQYLIQVVE